MGFTQEEKRILRAVLRKPGAGEAVLAIDAQMSRGRVTYVCYGLSTNGWLARRGVLDRTYLASQKLRALVARLAAERAAASTGLSSNRLWVLPRGWKNAVRSEERGSVTVASLYPPRLANALSRRQDTST